MGFLDSVKRKAQQAKLSGERLWVDRELTNVQHQLGVDLFQILLGPFHSSTKPEDTADIDGILPGLVAVFIAAFEDIQELMEKRNQADANRDQLEAKQDALAGQKEIPAGRRAAGWLSHTGGKAKCAAEIAYYDREIYLRKQIFGKQVVEECGLLQDSNNNANNNHNNINHSHLSEVPAEHQELATRIQTFQRDAQRLQQQRKDLQDEIARLSGIAPTENRSLVIPDESEGQFHAGSSASTETQDMFPDDSL